MTKDEYKEIQANLRVNGKVVTNKMLAKALLVTEETVNNHRKGSTITDTIARHMIEFKNGKKLLFNT